jgi:ABC-2 type transport system permease protein
MVALRTVYGWELRKLRAQKRTYLGLFAAMVVPLIFVVALTLQHGQPDDIAFGRYVRQSGLAIPPVILIFGSYWLFPLVTALVSGDIVAAEDHNGTLKTILTRSVDRGRLFTAKVLAAFTYAVVALLLMGIVATVAGVLKSGFNPLVTLSGTTVSAGRALELVGASLGVYMLPLFAIAAIALLLSTVTHNSAAAVVGALMISLLMQLITIIPGLGPLHPYLLPTQFNAWQGLLRTPVDWAPIVRAAWVCAAYAVPCLGIAFLSFLRRDVAGGSDA